jgi:nicotinamidase-related amidase
VLLLFSLYKSAFQEIVMLIIDKTALLVIDVQEKLNRVMIGRESLVVSIQKLIRGANVLGLAVIVTEQYPRGLGPTIPEVAELLSETRPIEKMCFSCYGDINILEKLKSLKREQILVAGIEAHVCVYQTVADLLSAGYEVHVVADCISSRTIENKAIALEKMKAMGAGITSVEIALFELLKTAESKYFKEISQIVK